MWALKGLAGRSLWYFYTVKTHPVLCRCVRQLLRSLGRLENRIRPFRIMLSIAKSSGSLKNNTKTNVITVWTNESLKIMPSWLHSTFLESS